MHLNTDEIERAAGIAAQKYFSGDNAIDRDDLVSIATLRILDRNPTTIGTAVHVGREGIMREIGYKRYLNATRTINLSAVTHQDQNDDADSELAALGRNRVTKSRPSSEFQKSRVKVRQLQKRLGEPLKIFGRFGVAYDFDKDFQTQTEFDVDCVSTNIPGILLITFGKKVRIIGRIITPRMRAVSNRHYVIAFLKR